MVYAFQLDLIMQKTNFGNQKIDNFLLKIFRMVIASF